MAPRREESPTGWYVGTYQLRFIELDDPRNEDENRRFLIWENTVLIKADRFVEAYRKVVKIGKSATAPYKGGPDGIDVRWVFEGVIDVLPVYEELADGAEILWAERTRTLKNVRKAAKTGAAIAKHHNEPRP